MPEKPDEEAFCITESQETADYCWEIVSCECDHNGRGCYDMAHLLHNYHPQES